MTTAVEKTSTNAPARVERFYQPELDALRFFAFLGVFIFHAAPKYMGFYDAAGAPRWLSNLLISAFGAGAFGVDLFFALSAYLITSLLLRERAATGALDLRGFYLRRILRIWPLYLAFVAFAAIFGWIIPSQRLPLHYVAAYCLLAGNWSYVFYGLPASFSVPLWTISIEEQFYLAWPLAIRKATVRGMAVIAVSLLIVANAWRVWLAITAAPVDQMEYNTFTRLDPIAWGVLIALFSHKLPQLARWQRIALLCTGVSACIAEYGFTVLINPPKFSTWKLAMSHPVTSLASAAVLLAVMGSQNSFLRKTWLLCSRIYAPNTFCLLPRRCKCWPRRRSAWRLPSCLLQLLTAGWKAHFCGSKSALLTCSHGLYDAQIKIDEGRSKTNAAKIF
jgi:peptidoglycan/LPS O-acetylase OafA/YrhL